MKGNQNKLNKNTIDIPHQTEVKQMTDLLLRPEGCLRMLQCELILSCPLYVWGKQSEFVIKTFKNSRCSWRSWYIYMCVLGEGKLHTGVQVFQMK